MKRKLVLLMTTAALFMSSPDRQGAEAGLAVVDAAAIATAKSESLKNIAQMVKELKQAEALYESVNGLTDMHDIVGVLNNPEVRELLGPEAMEIAALLDVDVTKLSGDLGSSASAVLDHIGVDRETITADDFYRQELDRINQQTARDAAVGERVITSADERLAGLDKLRKEVGKAETQKEMSALQARLQIETAMLQNDANRIQGLAMLQDAQVRAEDQRNREVADQRRKETSEGFSSVFGNN